jgi:hypothetical protein
VPPFEAYTWDANDFPSYFYSQPKAPDLAVPTEELDFFAIGATRTPAHGPLSGQEVAENMRYAVGGLL